MNDDDDEFGNFEEAVPPSNSDNNNNKQSILTASTAATVTTVSVEKSPAVINASPVKVAAASQPQQLPNWLLTSSSLLSKQSSAAKSTSVSASDDDDGLAVKQLQEELTRTKEQLIHQQTDYLQLQTQNQQQSHDHNISTTKMFNEFQNLLRQSLMKQREILSAEFKQLLNQQLADQERRFNQHLKDSLKRYEDVINENMEAKLVEYQEQLIKHNESEYQDIEMKVKLLVAKMFKEEQEKERGKLKQSIDSIEREIKGSTEKYVQNYFMSQSEFFKEQIKSGVLQEHLIHKDLINSKLDKLFRDSEEKRRQTNMLFARHVSSLNFFIKNAEKQMGILRDAHKDIFKNKEINDYYGKTIAITGGTSKEKEDQQQQQQDDSLMSDQEFYLPDNLDLTADSTIKSLSHMSLSAVSTNAAAASAELKHKVLAAATAEKTIFDEHIFD